MQPRLTPRQSEVFDLCCKGYFAVEIAKKLSITDDTVKSHKKIILRKYQARTMVQAVAKHYNAHLEKPEIVLTAKMKYRLRLLIQKLESELSNELVAALKEATRS